MREKGRIGERSKGRQGGNKRKKRDKNAKQEEETHGRRTVKRIKQLARLLTVILEAD
jgi:hypothetical protein